MAPVAHTSYAVVDIVWTEAVLVSVEPKGGSPQPTTAPFIGGKFPGV